MCEIICYNIIQTEYIEVKIYVQNGYHKKQFIHQKNYKCYTVNQQIPSQVIERKVQT